ncbi:MAG: CDP-diacylglycerol/glycerol-3-phosphate 3-phosphatidyltransferase [Candidatus Peribacteria bacterium]|nr:CDP-diacylglycerol/glycerol-3-phosphate 3-phosphatidyltransferase [Candidatus Peribacteria bacterium]
MSVLVSSLTTAVRIPAGGCLPFWLRCSTTASLSSMPRFTLATKITASRVFFAALTIIFLYTNIPYSQWLSLFFFVLAIVTDFLDGYIARRNKEVSALGIFLDPLVDKLTVLSVLIALVDLRIAAFWLVILTLFRELIVTSFRDYAGTKGIAIPSVMSGKIKSTLQYMAILAGIMSFGLEEVTPGFGNFTFKISWLLLFASVIFAWYGMYDIFRNNLQNVLAASVPGDQLTKVPVADDVSALQDVSSADQ